MEYIKKITKLIFENFLYFLKKKVLQIKKIQLTNRKNIKLKTQYQLEAYN
jgi:hypothetical protein